MSLCVNNDLEIIALGFSIITIIIIIMLVYFQRFIFASQTPEWTDELASGIDGITRASEGELPELRSFMLEDNRMDFSQATSLLTATFA